MGPRGLAVPLVFVLFGATTQPLEAEADTDPRQPASQEEDNEQAEAEEPAPRQPSLKNSWWSPPRGPSRR